MRLEVKTLAKILQRNTLFMLLMLLMMMVRFLVMVLVLRLMGLEEGLQELKRG